MHSLKSLYAILVTYVVIMLIFFITMWVLERSSYVSLSPLNDLNIAPLNPPLIKKD